jgi:translocation and assembly module TamB
MRFFKASKVLLGLFLVFGVSLLTLWSSQWWLPWLAPSVLSWASVSAESTERTEDGRLRVEGLEFAPEGPGGSQLKLGSLEMPNPWDYARVRMTGAAWPDSMQIEIAEVVARLGSSQKEEQAGPVSVHLPETVAGLERKFLKFSPWVPPVLIREASVQNPEGAQLLRIEELSLTREELLAKVYPEGLGGALELDLKLEEGNWPLSITVPHLDLDLSGTFAVSGEAFGFDGRLGYDRDAVAFEVRWTGPGWIPESASIRAEDFPMPWQFVAGLESSQIDEVRVAKLNVDWSDGRYVGVLDVEAKHEIDGREVAAMAAGAFEGDLDRLRIQKMDIDAPWAAARLETPVVVQIPNAQLEHAAGFRLSVDLSKQPFVPANGVLSGVLDFEPPSRLRFKLDGDGVSIRDYPMVDLTLAADLDESVLELEGLLLSFSEMEGASAEVEGRLDLRQEKLDLRYKFQGSRDLIAQLGGPDFLAEGLIASGTVSGEIASPDWSMHFEMPLVQLPRMLPFQAGGNLDGRGASLSRMRASVTNSSEQVEIEMSFSMVDETILHGRVEGLNWNSGGESRWSLESPATFSIPLRGQVPEQFAATGMEELALLGPEASWRLGKEPDGPLALVGQGFDLTWLGAWLEGSVPDYEIESGELRISDLRPFLRGTLRLAVNDRSFAGGALKLEVTGAQIGEQAEFESVRLSLGDENIFEGEGILPFRLVWNEETGSFEPSILESGPMDARMRIVASETITDLIERMAGLKLVEPSMTMEVSGTAGSPVGHLEAFSQSIQFLGQEATVDHGPIPDLSDVALRAEADGRSIVIKRLSAEVQGGLVEASGEWPLRVFPLSREPAGSFDPAGLLDGVFELRLSGWELQNWTRYLPAMLRRSGEIAGSLNYRPDAGLGGTLIFRDLGLRPTQNLPSVDSIEGSLKFLDRSVQVEQASARVGGSPVFLEGEADFSDWPDLYWRVDINGKNVPVIRRPEIILRSDLDLRIDHPPGDAAPNLSGSLGLRSSTMLVEFDPLSSNVRGGPASKPPFFAIDEAPFSQWGVDLRIEGDRFLRVRSPYFQSILSAGLSLTGRLEDPRLLGSIRIDEGTLSFPGAKMRLDSGEAFIEAAEPDVLQLDLGGAARTRTHVVTMDVSGSAIDPQIQFGSTPPLDNASILRLLTTGSTTGGGAGSVGLYLGRGLLGPGGMSESFADRITIDVGEGTTRSGKDTVGVRFDVNDDVYLQGEYDEYDSYNSDLVWSIFKR